MATSLDRLGRSIARSKDSGTGSPQSSSGDYVDIPELPEPERTTLPDIIGSMTKTIMGLTKTRPGYTKLVDVFVDMHKQIEALKLHAEEFVDAQISPHLTGFVNEDGFIDAPYPTTTDTGDRDDDYRHGHEDDRHARSRKATAELGRSRDRDDSTETTTGPTRSESTSHGPIGPGTENVGSGGRDDSSPSPGTSSPSGGGFASQGGNTSPVGGPNSNPGNRGSSSGNTRSGSSGGDGDGGGNSGGDGGGFKPIVLDLDGDGVELVALDESAAFYDINADGYQYNLGWAGADDGLLAYDKNSDGVINRKDEISFVDYVPGAQTDLEGLRNFDSNADSVLDASDAEFAKFRVWQDANQNGASDSGELRALVAAGIRSIELNYVPSDDGQPETRDGNIISGQGRYHKTNGASGTFADVAFAASAFGFRTDGDNLEFKSADGVGKVYVAPANAGGVNMNFASSVNAAHIGAIGGSHADVLNGGGVSRDLLLFGDEGNDRLTGGSGDDWLAGGAGADILRGGSGDDALFFDARDNVHGGGGQDVGVVSGSGAINLSMGAVGLEALHSGDGNDRLSGADSAQGVIIDGGGGADTMRGSHHRDVLSGGAGNDHIKGKPGDDVILGGAGDDDLFGNFGDDVLFGGEGDDYLNGLVGDDALYGGAGSDTYDFGYPNVPMGVLPDFGRETVRDSGGANDKVTFGRRRHEDLWLAKDGDDLRISILGGDDEVLIEDQFAAGGEHRIETLQAATRLYSYGRYSAQTVSIDALVNAMAGFDKPQAGWSHMTTQQRADVHAAWRSVGIAPTVG